MDFAPYQSSPPEHNRTLSPVNQGDRTASPRTSWDYARRPAQGQYAASPPPLQHPQPQRAWTGDGIEGAHGHGDGGGGGHGGNGSGEYFGTLGGREGMVSEFDTSLGIRLDYEACLAYVGLPPLGAIFLLISERNSDYVRFHAWQSALLFTTIFIVHLIFSWSSFLSWLLFIGDIALIAWLTLRAYQDVDTLDRYEVPVFGRIASRILDDE